MRELPAWFGDAIRGGPRARRVVKRRMSRTAGCEGANCAHAEHTRGWRARLVRRSAGRARYLG